ncbi:hypothetical protein NDA13_001415 [Ustilago tritici]|nr:hypothetical protein NDA13_001415 [Ustilago tritici]
MASQPRQSVLFVGLEKQSEINYEKYASPTGPRYLKPWVDLYSKSRTDPYGNGQEEDASVMGESNLLRSKPIVTPFPKFNPKDIEIFILEAEAWFKFNQVHEKGQMINHTGAQLEGNTCKWWTSKIRINRAREGRLFHDWHYFTERLMEQFNPRNARMEAYNKLLALCLTSDAPGAATHHVEWFRDLEGQLNLDENDLVIDLFQGGLTCSLQEKFERNPPVKRWGWYWEVEEIDRQQMLLQQSAVQHPSAGAPHVNPSVLPMPTAQGATPNQPLVPTTLGNPGQPNNWFLPQQMAQGLRQRSPANVSNSTCHLCKGTGHWARDCPNKKQPDPMNPQPMGPKVMVTTEDLTEEGAPASEEDQMDRDLYDPDKIQCNDLDLDQYRPLTVANYKEVSDNNDEGNVSGVMH